MKRVEIARAKPQLSTLLERVEAGEEIVITRRGKAIARLVREPRSTATAADVFLKAWALGGFDIDPVPDLAPEILDVNVD